MHVVQRRDPNKQVPKRPRVGVTQIFSFFGDGTGGVARFMIIGGTRAAKDTHEKDDKMKTTFLVAAIAAGITLAATAEARQGHGQGQRAELPAFEELDANADGSVTLAEIGAAMQARMDARFAETDTNGDGALSAEEMVAAADTERQERMAERVGKQIERMDANGDGMLQAEELAEAREDGGRRGPMAERLFDRFDADEDGGLSAEEFADATERMQQRGPRGDRGDHGGRDNN